MTWSLIALLFVTAALLAVLLEVLAREAAWLKTRIEKLRQRDFQPITKSATDVESKRLPRS